MIIYLLKRLNQPDPKNESITFTGSGYCNTSENGLAHEIQKTPIEILDLIIDYEEIRMEIVDDGNSYGLR